MSTRPDEPESASAASPAPEDADATCYSPTPTATDPAATRYSDGPLAPRYCGTDTQPPLTPPTIPGYELLGELGRGGMGVVYKARQLGFNRIVALKMILSGTHAGGEEQARFRIEAEAVARLQHPNIVQVHEVGEHEGRPFFSMEFCPGGGLDKKLHGTPLPAAEAARLVETLALAVHAAHEQQVVHRDMKPANVLLGADGTPKVADFGLAKMLDEAGQTATGAVMGTPSYMAPEQAAGKSREIGQAADVYALGAILYECLTGRPPFKAATTWDTLQQVVRDEPAPPRRLQSKTPRNLETICLKCLQKPAARRYATARELAEDLQRVPVRRAGARRTGRGSGEHIARRAHRNAAVTCLIAAVAATVLLGAAACGYFAIQAHLALLAKQNAEVHAHQTVKAIVRFMKRRQPDLAGLSDEQLATLFLEANPEYSPADLNKAFAPGFIASPPEQGTQPAGALAPALFGD